VSASPYGRHDSPGVVMSAPMSARHRAEVERDAAALVEIQRAARARLLGDSGTADTLKREQRTGEVTK